jgi:hypothetical protein
MEVKKSVMAMMTNATFVSTSARPFRVFVSQTIGTVFVDEDSSQSFFGIEPQKRSTFSQGVNTSADSASEAISSSTALDTIVKARRHVLE